MDELSAMSIKRLRLLDIQNAEQEAMVQTIVNAKVAVEPVIAPVKFRIPDIKNGEEEAYWQSKIDAAKEALRPKAVSMADIIPDGEVEIPEVEELDEVEEVEILEEDTVEDELVNKFCQSCDSKGGRHLKTCNRTK